MEIFVKELLKVLAGVFRAMFYADGNPTGVIDDDWKKMLTLEEYIAKYPECSDAKQQSVQCRFCGSSDIIYQPLTHSRDRREKHFCASCKRSLYKSYAEF